MEKMENKSKTYNDTYFNKHKTDPKIDCSICYGCYTVFNKHHHNNTMKHIKALKMQNNNPSKILNL